MKISALLHLVLLQTLLVNGARHYSPETPMVVVADVCGTNSNDLSQAFRPRSVANPLCKVHRFYQFCQLHRVRHNPFNLFVWKCKIKKNMPIANLGMGRQVPSLRAAVTNETVRPGCQVVLGAHGMANLARV